MLTSDFHYDLPKDRIAQHPAERGSSRLFAIDRKGEERHGLISGLPGLLRSGDLLVVNNTQVIPARLFAYRPETGGRVEVFLTRRVNATEWLALAKPGRKARPTVRLDLAPGLSLEVLSRQDDGLFHIRFSEPIEPHLTSLGHIPLPPYIKRADQPRDLTDYQTVYASQPGAIAAPTAGLHFNEKLLAALRGAGVGIAEITLHIGIGTFKPVTSELVHEHRMDSEWFSISKETADAIRRTKAAGDRIVAVGTTVVRSLESASRLTGGDLQMEDTPTDLFITPGYNFQVVDLLLTNFHLPRSTLLMLVCAFAGRERVLSAYNEAIGEGYRFYSYGDAMLAERSAPD